MHITGVIRSLAGWLLLARCCFQGVALGQESWLRQLGGPQTELVAAMANDKYGNIYCIGTFSGNASFGSYNMPSVGRGDIFVAKMSAQTGNVLWVRQIGSSGEDNGLGIACDKTGNVFCTGRFSGNVSFGSIPLNASGSFDGFVACLDPATGLVNWAIKQGGSGADVGLSITTDYNGSVFAAGAFQNIASFGSTTLSAGSNASRAYLLKVDANQGQTQWVQGIGGAGYCFPLSLGCNQSDGLFMAGQFDASFTAGNHTLTAVNYNDAFIIRFNAQSGQAVWAKAIGGNGNDLANCIAVDVYNNVYLGGRFEESLQLGNASLSSFGSADGFVCKIDTLNGDLGWIKQIGGSGMDQVNAIDTDPLGEVYVTGFFNGICNFESASLSSAGSSDIFLCRLNPLGDLTWFHVLGSKLADNGLCILANDEASFFAMGTFQQNLSFQSSQINAAGSNDVYFLKINKLSLGVVEHLYAAEVFKRYPSPTNSKLYIELPDVGLNAEEIRITDMCGREQHTAAYYTQNQVEMDVSDFSAGLYVVHIKTGKQIYRCRFVKN